MTMYPTKYEIYDTEAEPILMAEFTAFDGDSLSVKINDMILDADDLHRIAECLAIAQQQLKEGFKVSQKETK